jgi:sugar/nucleoside kinase (ribokinase family)
MADVLCLGEILVDWVCTELGRELDQAKTFTKAAGGAPANTAVGLARQGVPTGFIGRVSGDAFGKWLKSVLENEGIDTKNTVVDPEAQTRMAYVVTTSTGDRKLAEFSKIACADARLQPDDLVENSFAAASVLHFGSISLIAKPASDATKRAVELARQHNLLVSYDPNVRIGLWPSPQACKDAILRTLGWADLVKINEDELLFLTGSRDLQEADKLRERHNLPVLIVTLDARGAYVATKAGNREIAGFPVQLIEATGAGDAFNSGVISGLLPFLRPAKNRRQALEQLELSKLADIIRRANAVGAIACTRPGAIPALPGTEEIEKFISEMSAMSNP